jgi:opacity protein-like surface antigen
MEVSNGCRLAESVSCITIQHRGAADDRSRMRNGRNLRAEFMQDLESKRKPGCDPQWLRKLQVSLLFAVVLLFTSAQSASAGEFYLSGGIGVSGGSGKSGGSTPFFDNTGSDTDSSAMYGFALGFELPMNEPLPEQWHDVIPNWPIMAEFEATGGRDYEFLTDGGDPYRSDFTTWTVLHNFRFDLPVAAPFEAAFGRIPILQPLSFYMVGGLGISISELETTDNVSRGKDSSVNFAWQAGAGLGYKLSEYISLDLGYRYLDMGEQEFDLRVGPTEFGTFSLRTTAHEFTSAVRVRFFGVPLHGRVR